MFLSINIGKFHWYLGVVNATKREIHVLDSFGEELSDHRDLKTTIGLND
jgi:Ulp1 family protease